MLVSALSLELITAFARVNHAALHDFNTKPRFEATHRWLLAEVSFVRTIGEQFAGEVCAEPHDEATWHACQTQALGFQQRRWQRYGAQWRQYLETLGESK